MLPEKRGRFSLNSRRILADARRSSREEKSYTPENRARVKMLILRRGLFERNWLQRRGRILAGEREEKARIFQLLFFCSMIHGCIMMANGWQKIQLPPDVKSRWHTASRLSRLVLQTNASLARLSKKLVFMSLLKFERSISQSFDNPFWGNEKKKRKDENSEERYSRTKFNLQIISICLSIDGRVDLTLDGGSYEIAMIRGFTRVREGRQQPSTRLSWNFAFILAANFLTRYERRSREGVGGGRERDDKFRRKKPGTNQRTWNAERSSYFRETTSHRIGDSPYIRSFLFLSLFFSFFLAMVALQGTRETAKTRV